MLQGNAAVVNDPIVLGVDPGFASFGWSIIRLSEPPVVLAAGVIRTKKATERQKMLASEDSVVRAREIYRALYRIAASPASGDGRWPQAICAESMSWPRNAGAATKVALAWGVLVSVAEDRDLPLLQASPQQVKKALCGKRDASKEEVQDAVFHRAPTSAGAVAASKLPKGMFEHMYDSMAAALVCADSEVVRLLRRAA